MDIKSRPYTDSDYKNQRKLFELSFPETVGTSIASDAHYDWKFKTFPDPRPSYQYVSEDSELVGYYAAIPYKYKIGNESTVCGMVCDVMTHPDRRGKGIFTKLGHYSTAQMNDEGINFTSGYPIRPEVIPGHIKVGWKIVVRMPMYLRLLGLKTFLPKPIRFLSFVTDPLIKVLHLAMDFKNKNYEAKVYDVASFLKIEGYPGFLNLWLKEQRNALIKSTDFMKWRLTGPNINYSVVVVYRENNIVAISVVRDTVLKGVSTLAVLDIMILSDYFDSARTLHQEMKQMAIANKNDAIVCMTSPQWAKNYRFFQSLYIPTPAVFSLIIKKLKSFPGESDLFSPECWHLFWIDSDDL